jgi:hypothetical protein
MAFSPRTLHHGKRGNTIAECGRRFPYFDSQIFLQFPALLLQLFHSKGILRMYRMA